MKKQPTISTKGTNRNQSIKGQNNLMSICACDDCLPVVKLLSGLLEISTATINMQRKQMDELRETSASLVASKTIQYITKENACTIEHLRNDLAKALQMARKLTSLQNINYN